MKPFTAVKQIISKYKGVKVAFKDLPINHKLALVWYMACDGEAWEMPDNYTPSRCSWTWAKMKRTREFLRKNIAHFEKTYGHLKFGMVNVPMEVFGEIVLKVAKGGCEVDDYSDMKSFKEMNKRYMDNGDCPIHTELGWPAILNSSCNDDGMVIEDGWHRLNTYYKKKVKVMPLVYYLKGVKYC